LAEYKPIVIIECSDEDFSDEKLLIVVHDKDLKLTDSEPIEVQHLEMETCPVQVNVVSDPPMLSSTNSKVDFAPTSVATKQQEVAGESIVAAVSIIAEEQQKKKTF
jgi:hypothetical protein